MINRHVVMIDNHGGGARGGAVISAGDSGQRSKNGEPLTRLSATLSPGGEGFIWLTAYPVEYRIPSSSGSCPNNHAQYWEKTGAQFETEGSPCSTFPRPTPSAFFMGGGCPLPNHSLPIAKRHAPKPSDEYVCGWRGEPAQRPDSRRIWACRARPENRRS